MNNSKNSASLMARGAIITALSLVILYLSNIITINTVFFLGLASCLIPLGVMLTNIHTGIVVYLAVTIIGFFIIPDKTVILLYAFLFGLYGIVKYYIERLNKIPLEMLLKFIFFNISLGIMYFIYTSLFTGKLDSELPFVILLLLAEVAFFIYDYIITLFVDYANKNIIKKINKAK